MKKILFVCMGNICRSPAAEGIAKKIVQEKSLHNKILIDSAGTVDYHIGELPDERMAAAAERRGYKLNSRAMHFNPSYFNEYDYIICMDDENVDYVKRLASSDKEKEKIYKMTDFSTDKKFFEVPDPYYGGAKGFEQVLDILEDSMNNLINKVEKEIES